MQVLPVDLKISEKQTLKMDMIQQSIHGLALTLFQGIFVLILVDYFNATDAEKSIVSSALHIGFVIGLFVQPLILHYVSKRAAATILTVLSGLFLGVAALVNNLTVHVLFLLAHIIAAALRINILTAMYADHFPSNKRAQLFSFGLMLSSISSVSLGLALTVLFSFDLEAFRWVYLTIGLLYCFSSIAIHNMPVDKIQKNDADKKILGNAIVQPLKNLGLLLKYPRFGYVIFVWFIFGFANLWTVPVRVSYLAEAQDGLNLDPALVTLIVGVIPVVIRMFFYRIWAKAFDNHNFIIIRILINSIVGTGLLLFFISSNVFLIIVGQIVFNIGFSGSTFAWNLWVTKIAPEGETAHFMSVHTFFTGIRGIIGPFIGYAVFRLTSAMTIGIISITLVVISVIMLLPLIKHWDDNGLLKPLKKNNNRDK